MSATNRSVPSLRDDERQLNAEPAECPSHHDNPALAWLAAEHELSAAVAAAQASVARCEQALTRLIAVRQRAMVGSDTALPAGDRPRLELCAAPLTAREAQILALIADGMSNRIVAEALCLSPRTVERHIANLYRKIHVHNRAEATNYARGQILE